jgi:monovalent cation:H+ antiporter, CPA1 family
LEGFLATETGIIELLVIAAIVAIAVRPLRLPYTVALVVVGLLLTFFPSEAIGLDITLTHDLILALFVPPLVFEAAFHLDFSRLRATLLPILTLAIPGVLLTTFLIGGIVAVGVQIPIMSGLLFGALIAATDPVAVIALFRSLGAPRQLSVLVEGESLFNDGTAVVLFTLLAAAVGISERALPVADGGFLAGIFNFLLVSVGGIAIGLVLGWLVALLIARIDDYLIETLLTTVLAFGAYLIAERLAASGVLAVVGAGLVNGNVGTRGMSPTTRIVLFNFWEYAAFVVNSLVFLLIGLQVSFLGENGILTHLWPIIVAVVATVGTRALVVYGLSRVVNWRQQFVSRSYQNVLVWGGLRGAVSLALALSLPLTATEDFAEGNMLQVMTFGVVLFTLLGQGTSMQFLLRREGLIERDQSRVEYERRHGRLVAARAARDRVHELYRENVITARTWEHLAAEFDRRIEQCAEAQHQLLDKQPELHAAEIDDAWREGLRAQRVMVTDLVKDGVISEPVYTELVAEIDNALANEAEKDHLRAEKVRTEQAETRRLDAEAEERAKTEQTQSRPPATASQSTERLDES